MRKKLLGEDITLENTQRMIRALLLEDKGKHRSFLRGPC